MPDKYPDLERLARENRISREGIRRRHEEGLDAYLGAMPLRDRKAVTLDLATGTGKSFVMYWTDVLVADRWHWNQPRANDAG